ncbi:hypothetical protein RM69_00180 [Mesotoga sp. SC_NapDC3]|nr:hypothetical protein RM69_00180 [Mesotoga sp. SC_NapDC3]
MKLNNTGVWGCALKGDGEFRWASLDTFLRSSLEFFNLSSVLSMKTMVLLSSEAISPSSSFELILTLENDPFFIDSNPFSNSERALDI